VAVTEHPWRGYFLIAAAAFCWGAAATAGKAVFGGKVFPGAAAISPLMLSQGRTTFALIVLAGVLLVRRGPGFFRVGFRDAALCALVGVLGLAGSNYFYYCAIQKTTVAIAITLQYTAPVWVLLYMVFRGRQRATFWQVSAVVVALLGIALTIGLFRSGISLNLAGVAAALMASFSFALYNVGGQTMVGRHHQLQVMAYTLLGSVLLWIVINPPWRIAAQHYSGPQWLFLFLFGCLSTLVPYVFYFTGLKYLDPTRAVVTACLEPVFAILFAAVFIHESVGGLQVAGIAAVMAATVMVQMRARPQGGEAL
jgi:drug/metabolite transporter (DMT)-like permease